MLFAIAFEGSLGAAGVLLLLAYVAFSRMNKDVRRARLFIMADRVKRFLGAFTVGILLLAGVLILNSVGLTVGVLVAGVAIFLFLGAIVYGSLELFLIVRPRRARFPSIHRTARNGGTPGAPSVPPVDDPAEGDLHAAR